MSVKLKLTPEQLHLLNSGHIFISQTDEYYFIPYVFHRKQGDEFGVYNCLNFDELTEDTKAEFKILKNE